MTASRTEMTIALGTYVLAMTAVFILGYHYSLTGDTIHYRAMIAGEAAPEPFAYRVLTPAIVAALPMPSSDGFLLVAVTATLGTLLVMRALFRHLEVSPAAANAAVVFLCFSYPMANYLVHWERIDPLANFAFALTLLLILQRQFIPAALTMAGGVLAKETLLLLVPILFWHRIQGRRREPRTWAIALLLCALPLLTFAAVRTTVEIDPESFAVESPDDLALIVQSSWETNVEQFGLAKRIFREMTKSYGFFWALAAAGFLIDRRLRLESLYMIAIGFLLCIIAGDWARMLGTGFPGVFIPAALFLDRMVDTRSWRPWFFGLLGLSAAQTYLSFIIYRDLDRTGQLLMAAAILGVTLAGVGLIAWAWFGLHRNRSRLSPPPAPAGEALT